MLRLYNYLIGNKVLNQSLRVLIDFKDIFWQRKYEIYRNLYDIQFVYYN